MLKRVSTFILLLSAAGCISFGFKADRKSKFADVNNNILFVEYATEDRVETLPNGASLKFNRKIRVTMPDGKKVILYQTLSSSGVRYHTPDNEYVFIERGPWCQVLKNDAVVYQGLFRKNCTVD